MSECSPLRIRVVRTKGDYTSGVLLNAMRSPWTLALVGAAPVINACIMYWGARGDGADRQIAATFGIFVISVLAMIVFLAPCYWWAARISWRTPGALQPIDYEFDERGMHVKSAIGEGRTSWAIFTGLVEGSKYLLLRQRPNLVHIFPKRDLTLETIAKFRALVDGHVRTGGDQ